MSFNTFKSNMLSYMSNQGGISSYQDWAKFLVIQYDMTMRMGFQVGNNVSIQKGNTELMQMQVEVACLIALQKQKGLHTFINDIGKGVVGYWTGATLNQFPTPIIPAVGSFMNIATTSALVTKPGVFPDMGTQSPIMDSGIFLDILISAMMIHLTTLEGVYYTLSLYPSIPPMVAPGILSWVGYQVPPNSPSAPKVVTPTPVQQEPTVEEILQTIPDDNNTVDGSREVVASTGIHVLNDEGQKASPQIESVKSQLPADKPEFEEITTAQEQEVEENVKESTNVICNGGGNTNVDYTADLTQNYKVRSLSIDPIFKHKIRAQHGLSTDDIVCNLKNTASNLLEPIRAQYPRVRVNSAFRGTPSIVGKVSQHEIGEAVDIQVPGFTPSQYLDLAKWIAENTSFDQLIFEHGNSIWLHISTKRNGGNRKQKLTMYKGKYESGIKSYYS